jgi:hypothetical protein
MDALSTALLVLGLVTFGIGVLSRTYMNRQIRKLTPSRSVWASTETGYWPLARKGVAPAWPFFVTVVCLPCGVLMVFVGIVIGTPWTPQ